MLFRSPIAGPAYITSDFDDHIKGGRTPGLDIIYNDVESLGQPAVAVTDMIINKEGIDGYGGYYIYATAVNSPVEFLYLHHSDHVFNGNRLYTLTGRNQSITHNQFVKSGSIIAIVGNTGWSTGPHLHFEIRLNGVRVDPKPYIDLNNYSLMSEEEKVIQELQNRIANLKNARDAYEMARETIWVYQEWLNAKAKNPKIQLDEKIFRFAGKPEIKEFMNLVFNHSSLVGEVLALREKIKIIENQK